MISPHEYPECVLMSKSDIIHYHCWINNRCKYNDRMLKMDDLYNFMNELAVTSPKKYNNKL